MATLTRLSILVADSDIAQSQRTVELLGGLGVRDVVCAATQDSALEWLRARAFDVLLCSWKLGPAIPGLSTADDGVELIRMTRTVSPATRAVLIRPHSRAAQPEGIDTLERPFSSARLQALLQRAASPLGGLWCEVPQLSLTDILQMYHQGRRSITVLLSGPIAGRIRLVDGEIVHAESGPWLGLRALSRLLEADSGLLRTELTPGEGANTIVGAFESAILSAIQLVDERRRDSDAAAAGTAPTAIEERRFPPSAPQEPPETELAPSGRRKYLILALLSLLVGAVVIVGLLSRNTSDHSQATISQATISQAATESPSRPNSPAEGPVDARQSAIQGLNPSAPAPSVPDSPVPHTSPVPTERTAPEPVPTAPSGVETGALRAPIAERESFMLVVASTPTRVNVSEHGKVLGKTPLKISIERSSVARGPREFTLRQPGHEPYVLRQGSSKTDVRAEVVLEAIPASPDLELDADVDFEAEKRAPSPAPRDRRPNLDIRMRR